MVQLSVREVAWMLGDLRVLSGQLIQAAGSPAPEAPAGACATLPSGIIRYVARIAAIRFDFMEEPP